MGTLIEDARSFRFCGPSEDPDEQLHPESNSERLHRSEELTLLRSWARRDFKELMGCGVGVCAQTRRQASILAVSLNVESKQTGPPGSYSSIHR
jgi:hypothetical protein